MNDDLDTRQSRLTSMDYLMLVLMSLGVINEHVAFRAFQAQKSKLYRRMST